MVTHTFGIVDSIVFIGTIVFSVLIGVYFAFVKKQKTNDELLVGGRNMSVVPIALSLLATYMSAILVLGMAGEVYGHGTLICEAALSTLVYIPLGGFLFLPTLYNLRLTSAYEYLEKRFESSIVRLLATSTFVFQIVMYMGVVLYAPAIAMEHIVGLPIWLSIVIIGGSAAIYTSIGGIKAVVWTDVFQILMMYAGMFAVIIQGCINMGGISNVFKVADDHGRIEFFNFKVDPFTRLTTLSVFFGYGMLFLGAYGCHQTTVQRYCSLSSFKKAFLSLMMTGPLVSLTMVLAGIAGVVIFANYADCDPKTLGLIKSHDQIAPYFVIEFLSPHAGLVGLFIACLLSGALSTVSSGLNSLAAVTWEDFIKEIRIFNEMTDTAQGIVVKVIGLLYGVVIIGMGFLVSNLSGILPITLTVNGALSGPLLGIFLLGIFVPFSNKYGAIIGLLCAHTVTLWISFGSLFQNRTPPLLDFSIEGCSNETLSSVNITSILLHINPTLTIPVEQIEWPEKIYTISYLLYPLVGAFTTVIVGSIVSIFTGRTKMTKDQEKYIHPLIVKVNRWLKKKNHKENYELPGMQIANKKHHGTPIEMTRRNYDNLGFENS